MKKYIIAFMLAFLVSNVNVCWATTIAWDGHTLAADSQATQCEAIPGLGMLVKNVQFSFCKIHYYPKKHLWIAGAGTLEDINIFCAFLGEGQPLPKNFEGDFHALVVNKDGKCLLYEGPNDSTEVIGPVAIGSGKTAAVAAMMLGVSATKAIEIAGRLDIFTGGPIQSVCIKH
jgi:hypothetical protein